MRRRFFNNSSVREGAVMQFEHSVTYTFPFDCVVDLFLVGGGGGGGPAYNSGNNGHGGCGGFTRTILNEKFTKNQSISITIGEGGQGGKYGTIGTKGGDTKVVINHSGKTYVAEGGAGGCHPWANPPDNLMVPNTKILGGSGGGIGRVGPTDGASNGGSRTGTSYEGTPINLKGQGTTTAAFGEDDGKGPYYGAGGAACGYVYNRVPTVPNGKGGETGGGTWGVNKGNGLFFGAGGAGADFFHDENLNLIQDEYRKAGDGYQGVVLIRFRK